MAESPNFNLKRVLLVSALCLALLAGFALRSYFLDAQSFWEEELFSLDLYAGKDLAQMVQFNISGGDTQTPLYSILLQSWTNLAGRGEFAVRFFSVIPSVLTVALLYIFAGQLISRRGGIIAAILAAVNPFQIWYGQEARTYALTTLLTLISTVCFLRLASGRNDVRSLAAYVVFTNLAIFSHYFSYFVIAAQDLGLILCWLMWRAHKDDPTAPSWAANIKSSAKRITLAQALVFVPYLPWAPFAARMIASFPGWHTPLSPFEMFSRSFQAFNLGTAVDGQLALWLTAAFALLAAAGILRPFVRGSNQLAPLPKTKHASPPRSSGSGLSQMSIAGAPKASAGDEKLDGRAGTLFALVYFLLPFVGIALFVTYTGRIIFHERYFIIATPALLVILAHALVLEGSLSRAVVQPLKIAAFLLPFLFVVGTSAVSLYNHYYLPEYQKADIRSAMSYVANAYKNGDVIVTTNGGIDLVVRHYKDQQVPLKLLSPQRPFDKGEVAVELSGLVGEYKRIWLVPGWSTEIDAFVEDWLNRRAYKSFQRWYAKGRMMLYAVVDDSQPTSQPKAFNFADAIAISGIGLGSGPVQAGDIVPVSVSWKPLPRYTEELWVTLDLVDRLNRHHTRIRQPIAPAASPSATPIQPEANSATAFTQNVGLQVPYGTPPGTYTVEVQVYPGSNPRSLEVRDETGSIIGARAPVGSIQVQARENTPLGALDVPGRLDRNLTGELKLIGHDLSEVKLNVGQQFSLSLYWQALDRIDRDLTPVIELKSTGGDTIARFADAPAGGLHPIRNWAREEVVRDIRTLAIPREANSGWHTLSLHLEESGNKIGPEVLLGKIGVVSRTRIWAPPAIAYRTNAQFGSLARLLGYGVEKGVEQSGANYLQISLYWQAIGVTSDNFKAFVHLLDAGSNIVAQSDSPPASGSAPTSGWLEGEIIVDRHKIPLREPAPGAIKMRLGLYDDVSMSRLPATLDGSPVPDKAPVLDIPELYR